jgi:fatty acid desaturase
MWRAVASIVAGLVAWGVIVTLLNFGLRAAIPGYHSAEATLDFTLAMKLGRLIEAAAASVAAGAVVGLVALSKKWAPLIVGLIILVIFLPVHVSLWAKFPVWYHLAFLVPLVPLVVLGASLPRAIRTPEHSPA